MTAITIALAVYLLYPVLLLLVYTFNVAPEVFFGPAQWGLDNWRAAFQKPDILGSLWNSIRVWGVDTLRWLGQP